MSAFQFNNSYQVSSCLKNKSTQASGLQELLTEFSPGVLAAAGCEAFHWWGYVLSHAPLRPAASQEDPIPTVQVIKAMWNHIPLRSS